MRERQARKTCGNLSNMNSTKIITAVIHQELVQAPAAPQWISVVHTLLQGLMHNSCI